LLLFSFETYIFYLYFQLIHSSHKLIIVNLHKKLKKDNPKILNNDAITQLAEQTDSGLCSIKKTLLEYKNTDAVISPNKKNHHLSFKEKIDEFHKNAIRRKVHEFYFNKELPTLNKVLQAVNADKNLPNFKRSTLHLLLNFTYTTSHSNSILREDLISERKDLISWRRNLRTIYKELPRRGSANLLPGRDLGQRW